MIYAVSFIISLLLLAGLIFSLRMGIIETKYSLLWIITFLVLGFLSISESTLEYIASLLGVHYAPSVLFLFGLLFSISLIFDLTRRISKLNKQLVALIQEHTLLVNEFQRERKKKEDL